MYTSTVAWALIASWYASLPYQGDGLMLAMEPWSGHYSVPQPLWVSAHTAQYAQPGWYYLPHGSGVGRLDGGGSVVSLMSPDADAVSIVIETLTHDQSVCIRPDLPPYNVSSQNVTLVLGGSFQRITRLALRYSRIGRGSCSTFESRGWISVTSGRLSIDINPDSIYSFSSTGGQTKGTHPGAPASAPFPLPFTDDFDSYAVDGQAAFFIDQTGSWQIADATVDASHHGRVSRQQVLLPPISWVQDAAFPVSIVGDALWCNVSVTVDVLIESPSSLPTSLPSSSASPRIVSVGVAARVAPTGADVALATGVFLWLDVDAASGESHLALTSNVNRTRSLAAARTPALIATDTWHTLTLVISGASAAAFVDGAVAPLLHAPLSADVPTHGCTAITSSFDAVQHDNFFVHSV